MDHIVSEPAPWISQILAPASLKRPVEAPVDAQDKATDRVVIETAKKAIADCDKRMFRYCWTPEAGGGPQEVVIREGVAGVHGR